MFWLLGNTPTLTICCIWFLHNACDKVLVLPDRKEYVIFHPYHCQLIKRQKMKFPHSPEYLTFTVSSSNTLRLTLQAAQHFRWAASSLLQGLTEEEPWPKTYSGPTCDLLSVQWEQLGLCSDTEGPGCSPKGKNQVAKLLHAPLGCLDSIAIRTCSLIHLRQNINNNFQCGNMHKPKQNKYPNPFRGFSLQINKPTALTLLEKLPSFLRSIEYTLRTYIQLVTWCDFIKHEFTEVTVNF